MRKQLFEVAILLHPTEDEAKGGRVTELLLEPRFILAADHGTANILTSREIPDIHLDKLDRIEVAVRPF